MDEKPADNKENIINDQQSAVVGGDGNSPQQQPSRVGRPDYNCVENDSLLSCANNLNAVCIQAPRLVQALMNNNNNDAANVNAAAAQQQHQESAANGGGTTENDQDWRKARDDLRNQLILFAKKFEREEYERTSRREYYFLFPKRFVRLRRGAIVKNDKNELN